MLFIIDCRDCRYTKEIIFLLFFLLIALQHFIRYDEMALIKLIIQVSSQLQLNERKTTKKGHINL